MFLCILHFALCKIMKMLINAYVMNNSFLNIVYFKLLITTTIVKLFSTFNMYELCQCPSVNKEHILKCILFENTAVNYKADIFMKLEVVSNGS